MNSKIPFLVRYQRPVVQPEPTHSTHCAVLLMCGFMPLSVSMEFISEASVIGKCVQVLNSHEYLKLRKYSVLFS